MTPQLISLPSPFFNSSHSIERVIHQRRSTREYADEALSLAEISQLLWAGQGITDRSGYRTAPSAGALYPLELYLIVGNVCNLTSGIYHYRPEQHDLKITQAGDKRSSLFSSALKQECIINGAVIIVIAAVDERTFSRYGNRTKRYIYTEVGHVAQNISLQAEALNLGTVMVGAFEDSQVKRVLALPDNERHCYMIPIGRKRD